MQDTTLPLTNGKFLRRVDGKTQSDDVVLDDVLSPGTPGGEYFVVAPATEGTPLTTTRKSDFVQFTDMGDMAQRNGGTNAGDGVVVGTGRTLDPSIILVFNVLRQGAVGNDNFATDSTAAFQAAIDLAKAVGGRVYVPPGKYRIAGQILDATPGNAWALFGDDRPCIVTDPTACSTVIKMDRSGGNNGRIELIGATGIEICGLTFTTTENSATPFIKAINPNADIHDCLFWGFRPADHLTNFARTTVAIRLGGNTASIGNTINSGFQGYGAIVRRNLFQNCGTCVYLGTWANGVVIENNTVWNDCGDQAAFLFDGTVDALSGVTCRGNLIELASLKYAYILLGTNDWHVFEDSYYDLNHLVTVLGIVQVSTSTTRLRVAPSTMGTVGGTQPPIIIGPPGNETHAGIYGHTVILPGYMNGANADNGTNPLLARSRIQDLIVSDPAHASGMKAYGPYEAFGGNCLQLTDDSTLHRVGAARSTSGNNHLLDWKLQLRTTSNTYSGATTFFTQLIDSTGSNADSHFTASNNVDFYNLGGDLTLYSWAGKTLNFSSIGVGNVVNMNGGDWVFSRFYYAYGGALFGNESTDTFTFTGRCILRVLASDPKDATVGNRPAGSTGEIARYSSKLYHCTNGATPTWEQVTSA